MSAAVRAVAVVSSSVVVSVVLPLSVGASLTLLTVVPIVRSTALQAPVMPVPP